MAESGQADFQVDRESYSAGIVTVTVRVAGGSATPGQDFASPGESTAWRDVVVTFQNNETQKLVPVPVLRDGKTEGAETFTLELAVTDGGRGIGRADAGDRHDLRRRRQLVRWHGRWWWWWGPGLVRHTAARARRRAASPVGTRPQAPAECLT